MADVPLELDAALEGRLARALDIEGKIPRVLDALGPIGGRDVILVDGADPNGRAPKSGRGSSGNSTPG